MTFKTLETQETVFLEGLVGNLTTVLVPINSEMLKRGIGDPGSFYINLFLFVYIGYR